MDRAWGITIFDVKPKYHFTTAVVQQSVETFLICDRNLEYATEELT